MKAVPDLTALLVIQQQFVIVLTLIIMAGCQPTSSHDSSSVHVELKFEPSPPLVGVADVELILTDASGQPIRGGTVELEGNMNHAGMKPVFSELKELEPGTYAGTLEFTMGGDWFVLVTGSLPGNTRLYEKIDIRGVKHP